MSSLVAFILGAGSNIGQSVATLLKQKGYIVAFGSRNPDIDRVRQNGFFPVQVDVTSQDSIKKAFATVKAELGYPNVVIYNAASFNPPPVQSDPLSLPLETFHNAISFGSNVYTTAQEALPGFRSDTHNGHPKAFIVTGNYLPHSPTVNPLFTGLDIQKVIQARLVNLFSGAYREDNIRFYFASLVSKEGKAPGMDVFSSSGPTHAKVYWDLINSSEQKQWDQCFTADGEEYPSSN